MGAVLLEFEGQRCLRKGSLVKKSKVDCVAEGQMCFFDKNCILTPLDEFQLRCDLNTIPFDLATSLTPKAPVLSVSARKIKDNAAEWHNLMMKWETLNDNGFSTATKIVNIKIGTEFKDVRLETEYDAASETEKLPVTPDYNVDLELCCTELLTVFESMTKIQQKMERLCSTTKGICELEKFNNQELKTPYFHTWPTPYFYEVCMKLLNMYSQELKLKQTIVQEIAHTADQDLLMVYLSSWLYQPYIDNTSTLLLESMLLETGHRKL